MMRRPILTALCFLAVLAPGGLAQADPLFPYPWPDYSVVPILFSPTDWDVNDAEVQDEAAALRTAMVELQQAFGQALGGPTFRLNDLQVVQGFGAKEDYGIHWNGGDIYTDGVELVGNVEAAIVQELYSRGFPTPPGQDEDGYSVLIFVKGAGGWAVGRELVPGDGGWGFLGDWAIDSIQGDIPEGDYWWSGRRLQIGAVGHELGHVFGLPHPDFYGGDWSTTFMGEWWNYPNLGFNDWELDFLRNNKAPFFATVPEPSSLAMLGAGALGMLSRIMGSRRRRRGS